MPITNQMMSRSQVVRERWIIRYRAETAPAGATNQIHGARNARGRPGSRTRSTSPPTETITNASSGPIDTRLAASRIGRIAAKNATVIAGVDDVVEGGLNLGG